MVRRGSRTPPAVRDESTDEVPVVALRVAEDATTLAGRVRYVKGKVAEIVAARSMPEPESPALLAKVQAGFNHVLTRAAEEDAPRLESWITRETPLDQLLQMMRGRVGMGRDVKPVRWFHPDRKTMGRLLAAFQRTEVRTVNDLITHFSMDGGRINVALLLHFFTLTQPERPELAHVRNYGEYTLGNLEEARLPASAEVLLKALYSLGVITQDLRWNVPPPRPSSS